ncbi:unnamed protein product [Caenorhabditis brenneri]
MQNDKWSGGIEEAVYACQLTSAVRPLHRAVAFACCLSALNRTPLLMRPGPPIFRQMTPSDVALGTDARSPLTATYTGLLLSLHPHLSTTKKLVHRHPPRCPVKFREREALHIVKRCGSTAARCVSEGNETSCQGDNGQKMRDSRTHGGQRKTTRKKQTTEEV